MPTWPLSGSRPPTRLCPLQSQRPGPRNTPCPQERGRSCLGRRGRRLSSVGSVAARDISRDAPHPHIIGAHSQDAVTDDNGLHVEIAGRADALRVHLDGWRRLVDAVGVARSDPAWLLAWWRHVGPPRSGLRVAVVRDRRDVVAVAPYFAHRTRGGRVDYRPLRPGFADPIGVLSQPSVGWAAAALIAAALAGTRPRPTSSRSTASTRGRRGWEPSGALGRRRCVRRGM